MVIGFPLKSRGGEGGRETTTGDYGRIPGSLSKRWLLISLLDVQRFIKLKVLSNNSISAQVTDMC